MGAFIKPPKKQTVVQNLYGMNPYDVDVLKKYFDLAAGRNKKMSIQEFFFFVGIMNTKIRGEALINLVQVAFSVGDSSNVRNNSLSFDEFLQAYAVVLREQGKVPDTRPGYGQVNMGMGMNNCGNCMGMGMGMNNCGYGTQSNSVYPSVFGNSKQRYGSMSYRPRSEFCPPSYNDDSYDYDRRSNYDDYDMYDLRKTFRKSPFYECDYDDYHPPRYNDYDYDHPKVVYSDRRDYY